MGKKAKRAKKEYRAALARVGSQLLTQAERFKYSDSQARDEHGRFAGDGSADAALAEAHHPVDRGGNTVCSCGFGDDPKFVPYHGGGSGGDQSHELRSRDDFFHHLQGVASMGPVARAQADVAARNARTPNPILAAMGQPTNKASYRSALARAGSTLLTAPERARALKYSEDQPRDEQGRFTSGGGGDSGWQQVTPGREYHDASGNTRPYGQEMNRSTGETRWIDSGVQHGEIVSHGGEHAMVTTGNGLNAGKWGVFFYDPTTGHPLQEAAAYRGTKAEAVAEARRTMESAASGGGGIQESHDRHEVAGIPMQSGCPACGGNSGPPDYQAWND